MFRPSFSVTALTLSALTLLGFVAVSQRYRLPLPPVNGLGESTSAYLQQGSHQPINWRTLDDEAFLQARRRGQPILLVIGAPWSAVCRAMDRGFFENPDTTGFLNRTFVCVRLDGNESPEWMACLYPITRGKLGLLPEFQMWVIEPQGKTVRLFARDKNLTKFDPQVLKAQLKRAVEEYASGTAVPPPGMVQLDDRNLVRDSTPTLQTPFQAFSDDLRAIQTESQDAGLIPASGLVLLNPGVWQYQYSTGQGALVDVSLDQLIYSPMFDAVDGGFYHSANANNRARCTFDKVATENAAMAVLLAQRSVANMSATDAELARMTFDFIEQRLGMEEGIASAQIGDEQRDRRSARQSFPMLRLAELPANERPLAVDEFGLRRDINPHLLPFFTNELAVTMPSIEGIRKRIQDYRSKKPLLRAENRIASVEGFTVARMIDTARILGDPNRAAQAQARLERLSDFFLDGEVLKVISSDKLPPVGLVSYLALADAYLSSFLATGSVTDLQQGERVLRAALSKFATGRAGVYRVTGIPTDQKFSVQAVDVADIADRLVESATARLMRLCRNYGLVLGDEELLETSVRVESKFAAIARLVGSSAASFFASAASHKDPTVFVTVGNQAPELAAAVSGKSPFRLVIPAVGPAFRELQSRPAGVYVVNGKVVKGPLTVPEAVSSVSMTYEIGD